MKQFYTLMGVLVASAMSFSASAQNELVVGDVNVGDLITLSDGSKWYVGTNEITNGSFDLNPSENSNNIVGWTLGNYQQMTTSQFLWFDKGGYDGGAYIQANGHSGAAGANSVGQRWTIEPNTRYYFSFYLAKNSANNQYIPVVSLTANESTAGGQNETGDNGQMVIGMNGGTETTGLQPLGYGNYVDNDGDGVGDWCQTACSFNSLEYTYLQFNARWLKENKIQACFDGFFLAKLYDPETTSQSTVAYLAKESALTKINSFIETEGIGFDGINAELSDFPAEFEINGTTIEDMDESTDLAILQEAIKAIDSKIAEAKAAVANAKNVQVLLDSIGRIMESDVLYPGINDLNDIYSKYSNEYIGNDYVSLDEEYTSMAFTAKAVENLTAAIKAYYFSQEVTPEEPANYSFLIDQPSFATQGKWTIGTSGGDQRVKADATDNEGNVISCWNAWRNSASFTDNTIKQQLTGIPNGYYTVTADLNTQDGCITDQHIFATSSTDTKVSPVLSVTGWDPMVWETLTTEKIIVVDGKLTIGATSNGMEEMPSGFTDYRGGWFCVTNFVLNYYGPASDDDIATAIAGKFAEAEELTATIHLAADKAEYSAAIADAKASNDLDALNTAISTAKASEAEYEGVINGTYKNLQDSIAKYPGSNQAKIAQVLVDLTTNYINSAEATYKNTGEYTTILRDFLNNLAPAIIEAENASETVTSEEGKNVLKATIDGIVTRFTSITTLPTSDSFNAAIAELKNAITVANAADIEIKEGADVTGFIANNTCDGTDVKAVPVGWTIEMTESGNGNYTNKGQQFDGQTDKFYLDAWNGTAGTIKYNAHQTLNVPNGTYELSAYVRTSGEGFYLYAIADEGTPVAAEVVPFGTNYTKYVNSSVVEIETGADSIVYDYDTHGELWVEAAEKAIAAMSVQAGADYSIYDAVVEKNAGSVDCPAELDENTWAILAANNGAGRGWMKRTVSVEVTNHVLTIGVATGDAIADAKAFTGTWFSADNFTLKLLTLGNNDGWSITTGVDTVETAADASIKEIFTISGARVSSLQNGLNIVKMSDGSVKKIIK